MKNRPVLLMMVGAALMIGGLVCMRTGVAQMACIDCDDELKTGDTDETDQEVDPSDDDEEDQELSEDE